MNFWFFLIVSILVVGYLLELLVTLLNLTALNPELPEEFHDIFDAQKYAASQDYARARIRLSLVSSTTTAIVTLLFFLLGGFNTVDLFARGFGFGSVLTGLIFTAVLATFTFFLGLPFSIYSTFVIEERFGFNRTTPRLYVQDILKSGLLAISLGGPILALIFWFFETIGTSAWLYCWLAVVIFSLLIQYLAPAFILPLFNTFTPLEHGSLREKILDYARRESFQIQGIFTMDGSKRSTKLNAFFTGFGKYRKIVFYDTLLAKLNTEEIIAVLAHEMGHFKHQHIRRMLLVSGAQTGIIFFLLSLMQHNPEVFIAFGMSHVSVYASLVFFGILYTPVNILVSVLIHHLSRKHEYQADAYAVATTAKADNLISGLKKLSQANLTNLTPHPLTVFLHYTHPPVLQRIDAIRELARHDTFTK